MDNYTLPVPFDLSDRANVFSLAATIERNPEGCIEKPTQEQLDVAQAWPSLFAITTDLDHWPDHVYRIYLKDSLAHKAYWVDYEREISDYYHHAQPNYHAHPSDQQHKLYTSDRVALICLLGSWAVAVGYVLFRVWGL